MASKLLMVALLSSCLVFVRAAPSAEELALRAAITSKKAAIYTLTKSITLTSDLPVLPTDKVLTVRSAAVKGAPFTIDGMNKFRMFRDGKNGLSPLAHLTIARLTLKRSPACINISNAVTGASKPKISKVTIDRVNFLNNNNAISLQYVNVSVSNSVFSRGTGTAVRLSNIWQVSAGLATFTGCTFTGNIGPEIYEGAGIFSFYYLSVHITKCKFLGNKASYQGGAVANEGTRKVVIRDSEFTNNGNTDYVGTAGGGGAISQTYGTLYVYNSTFKNNSAPIGGAVLLLGLYRTEGVFQRSKFIDNKATRFPGGAFLLDDLYSEEPNNLILNLCSCTFSGNQGEKKPSNINVVNSANYPVTLGTNPVVRIPHLYVGGDSSIKYVKGSCTEKP